MFRAGRRIDQVEICQNDQQRAQTSNYERTSSDTVVEAARKSILRSFTIIDSKSSESRFSRMLFDHEAMRSERAKVESTAGDVENRPSPRISRLDITAP